MHAVQQVSLQACKAAYGHEISHWLFATWLQRTRAPLFVLQLRLIRYREATQLIGTLQ